MVVNDGRGSGGGKLDGGQDQPVWVASSDWRTEKWLVLDSGLRHIAQIPN